MSPGRRIYKLSLISGLILSSPLIAGTLWYAWSTFATLDQYRRELSPKDKIDSSLFQIALHDELSRDLRRLDLPERPIRDRLPTFSLALSRESLDDLVSPKKDADYVDAHLEKDGTVHDVKVRRRGNQPWHRLGAQKSLKVRAEKGDLVEGVRVFNLLNDPTPFGLEDQLILDLARESGLLAPEYFPARVRLNNTDLGVFRFEAQPDESLLRRARRIPGNMYSGDTDEINPQRQVGALFFNAHGWTKIASRSKELEEDRTELVRFLEAINSKSYGEFATYAKEEIDLERYALFDALDVVFAGSEHDYFSNHKLYADPYRGKLEPVAWSFRGFQQADGFNLVDHPLLIRLKSIPGYLAARDRAVYQLLTGIASVPSLQDRADRAMGALAPELAADPFWDAYKLLPRVTKLHRSLLRPMTLDRWVLASAWEMDGFARRGRYLLDVLEHPNLVLDDEGFTRVALTVKEHGAYLLRSVRAGASCQGQIAFWADADLDGHFDPGKDVRVADGPIGQSLPISGYDTLTPRVRLIRHPDAKPKLGTVRAEAEPTTFTYFLESKGCAPTEGALFLESLVTGASVRFDLGRHPSSPPANPAGSIEDLPHFAEGDLSPHPWSYPAPPAPRTIALGPGLIQLPEGRSFGESESVQIAAGTTFLLGPDASLIFRGKVHAAGTSAAPIVIAPLDPKASYGGLALLGPGTHGSRLSEVRVRGGTKVKGGSIDWSALINLHDTRDIVLEDWRIEGNVGSGDVIHAYRVEGLALHDLTLLMAPVDGIDLELVSADLRGVRVLGAGDDCLDLMTSKVRVQDSLLLGCRNNAVSAGEETEITANGVVIADSDSGFLAKNASEARVLRSLIYRVEKGLKARRDEVRYAGKSRIGTSEVFIVETKKAQDADDDSTIEIDQIRTELPEADELTHLLEQTLGIDDWSKLDEALERIEREAGLL